MGEPPEWRLWKGLAAADLRLLELKASLVVSPVGCWVVLVEHCEIQQVEEPPVVVPWVKLGLWW